MSDAPQWKAMDSVPDDGREVLLFIREWLGGPIVVKGYWNGQEECWDHDLGSAGHADLWMEYGDVG